LCACAMALKERRRGEVLIGETTGIAGAATVVGAAEEPGCRVMVFGRIDQIFRTHHSP